MLGCTCCKHFSMRGSDFASGSSHEIIFSRSSAASGLFSRSGSSRQVKLCSASLNSPPRMFCSKPSIGRWASAALQRLRWVSDSSVSISSRRFFGISIFLFFWIKSGQGASIRNLLKRVEIMTCQIAQALNVFKPVGLVYIKFFWLIRRV